MATATKTFKFEIVTPEQVLFTGEVNKLVAVSETGEFGILPNHADMLTKLDAATMTFWQDKHTEVIAVVGGILEVKNHKVTVITDFAEMGADIDEAEAHQEAEKARLEIEMLKKKDINSKTLLLAEHRLRKETIKLQASRLKKSV